MLQHSMLQIRRLSGRITKYLHRIHTESILHSQTLGTHGFWQRQLCQFLAPHRGPSLAASSVGYVEDLLKFCGLNWTGHTVSQIFRCSKFDCKWRHGRLSRYRSMWIGRDFHFPSHDKDDIFVWKFKESGNIKDSSKHL